MDLQKVEANSTLAVVDLFSAKFPLPFQDFIYLYLDKCCCIFAINHAGPIWGRPKALVPKLAHQRHCVPRFIQISKETLPEKKRVILWMLRHSWAFTTVTLQLTPTCKWKVS